MPVRIISRAKQLLIVPLNSGKTIHLAPSATSELIADIEINGNERVAKLLRNALITTMQAKAATVAASAATTGKDSASEKDVKKELKKK